MRMPARPSVTSEVIAATSAWVRRESRRSRRPMRLTGTRATAKTAQMPMVSGQSMLSSTAKVATMVRIPVRPPSIDRTALPISADVGGEAGGEAGRRLGLQPREVGADQPREHGLAELGLHAVGDAVAGDLLDVLADGRWRRLRPITPSGPHQITDWRALLEGGHHQLDELRVAGGGERDDARSSPATARAAPGAAPASRARGGARARRFGAGLPILHRRCAEHGG